jgi:hypothetical protein
MFRKYIARKHNATQAEESRYTINSESQSVMGGQACFFFKELPKGINKAILTVSEIGVKNKQGEDIYHINKRELFVPHNGVYDPSKIDVLVEKGFIKSERGYTLVTEEKITPDDSLEKKLNRVNKQKKHTYACENMTPPRFVL